MHHRGLHRHRAGRDRLSGAVAATSVLLLALLTFSSLTHRAQAATQPATTLHYAANGNFDSSGNYTPGALGFNLADVSSKGLADAVPSGVSALVYIGLCGGADATFVQTLTPYIGDPHVFGFYLMDEPDPTGLYKTLCPAANLKAESDWIHQYLPGVKTMIVLMNLSSSTSPTFQNTYNPANSDVDLYALDPYPCRTELNGCNDAMITNYVNAAEAFAIPQAAIVPVFQAFGGGTETDDGGGYYLLPTASQEAAILATWGQLIPQPVFDYAYSWGTQFGDVALSTAPSSLQQVFAQHNAGTTSTTTTTTVPATTTTVPATTTTTVPSTTTVPATTTTTVPSTTTTTTPRHHHK